MEKLKKACTLAEWWYNVIMEDMNYERIENLLKEDVKPIVEENEQLRAEKEAQGEFFNIFSILGVERNEVHTHSAFLAELLNPKGSHGLKDAFLKLFVKEMSLDAIEDKSKLKTETATVRKEFYVGKKDVENETGGDIDILIEFSNPNYAVVIENKIDAGDQEAQLARYRNYAKKYGTGFTLFYLTKDGHEPSEWSIGKETDKHYWRCISYAHDVKSWLQNCMYIIQGNTIVYVTIKQYIGLINKITNQTLEANMEKKLVDLMINNFEEILTIRDTLNQLDSFVYDEFKAQMEDLAKELNCTFMWNGEIWNSGTNQYIYFIPKEFPSCKIGFGKEKGHEVFYYLEKESVKKNQSKLSCFSYSPQKGYPYGWEWFKYKEWNTDTIRAIHNGELKSYMKACIEEIINDENFPK